MDVVAESPDWLRSRFVSRLLVAGLLVALTYPAAVFFGGSLAPSNLRPVVAARSTQRPVSPTWPSFEQAITRSKVSQFADVGAAAWQFEPSYRRLAADLHQGRVATWDPSVASGIPRAGALVDAQLSPLSWAAALGGGGPTAFTFAVLGFLVIGATALLQVLEEYADVGRAAAVAGSAVFVANGFAAGYLNSQVAQPYFLAPLVLLALAFDDRRATPFSFAVGALATAACIAAAFAPVVLLVVVTVHVLALVLAETITLRLILRRALITVVGALLALPVLLPAIDFMMIVEAGELIADRSGPPRSLATLLGLLTPAHVWHTLDPGTYPDDVITGWTSWLGVSTVALMAAAKWRSSWRDWLPKAMVIVAALIHGHVLPRTISDNVLLSTVRPVYWASVMGIGAAFVVGTTLESVARRASRWRLLVPVGIVVIAATSVATAVGHVVDPAAMVFNLLMIVAVVGAVAARRGLGTKHQTVLLSAVIVVELVVHVPHLLPPRVDVVNEPNDVVRELRARGPAVRFINADRRWLHPDWASPLGLHQLGTFSFPQPRWYREFYHSAVGGGPGGLFLHTPFPEAELPVGATVRQNGLDAAAVRFMVAGGGLEIAGPFREWPIVSVDELTGMTLRENRTAFPRAYVAGAIESHDFSQEPSPTYEQEVVLSDDEAFLQATSDLGTDHVQGTTTIRSYDAEHVEIDVNVDRRAVLVLVDSWYPRWRAEVDGSTAYIGRVNQAFRGVVVPEGRSTVAFTYVDRPFQLGVIVSGLTILGLLVWIVASGRLTTERARTGSCPRSRD